MSPIAAAVLLLDSSNTGSSGGGGSSSEGFVGVAVGVSVAVGMIALVATAMWRCFRGAKSDVANKMMKHRHEEYFF